MANPFQQAGAQPVRPAKYAPLFTNRFFTGLWTQRNPLRDAATPYLVEKAYGGRYDFLIDGQNTEITNRLTLARRPGLSVYNSQLFPAIQYFYEFRQIFSGIESIRVLADSSAIVYDATGPATQTTVFTKSAGAGQTYFQAIGNRLFMGNGVDTKQWDGTNTYGVGITAPSDNLIGYTVDPFGFNTWRIGYQCWTAGATNVIPMVIVDPNFNLQLLTTAGVSDVVQPTWGTNPNDTTIDGTAIWTQIGGILSVATQYPEAGATYAYAFKSSLPGEFAWSTTGTGSVSTASPILRAEAGGPVMTVHHVDGAPYRITAAGMDTTVDPQVDTIQIYRTLSGGHTLFLLAEIQNPGTPGNPGTWDYTDTIPDAGLNEFIIAAVDHANDVPVVGLINLAFHLGRLFGSVGNTVYFSGGPDTTTGTGNTAFPPANFFAYPSAVKRIWPMAMGAVVFTSSDTYIILGQGTETSPLYSIPFLKGLSLANYNAFDANGIIAYLLTTDLTAVTLEPGSGYSEIGFPIGDQIEDRATLTNTYITWHNGGSGDKALYVSFSAGSAGTAGFGDAEVPSGAINSANTSFILSTIPNPAGSLKLYLNGVLQVPGADYTLASRTVTYIVTPPQTGDSLIAYYRVAATGTFDDAEVPGGAIDGGNGTFTLVNPPNQAASLMLYLNGVLQTAGIDYTLAGSTITYIVTVPQSGDSLIAFYREGAATGYADAQIPTGAINSVNKTFTLASQPVPATSLQLFLNGVEQRAGADYTLFGTSVVFVSAPRTGDKLIGWWRTGAVVGTGSGWFRMNQTAAPETGLNWSPFASVNQVADPTLAGCSAVQSIETEPGIHKLLVGPFGNGPILMRDLSVKTDNGTAFSAYATAGSFVLAQPGQLAGVVFITADCPTTGTHPVPSIWLDENSVAAGAPAGALLTQWVNDPPQLPASATITGRRYYLSQTEDPAWCRHMQIKFDWGTVDSPDELYSYAIFGTVNEE